MIARPGHRTLSAVATTGLTQPRSGRVLHSPVEGRRQPRFPGTAQPRRTPGLASERWSPMPRAKGMTRHMGRTSMNDDLGTTDAALTAFEQAPVMLWQCEGDPLVVTACNALARARFGERAGDGVHEVFGGAGSRPNLADRLEQVVATGEPFTLRDHRLAGGAADGRDDVFADVIGAPVPRRGRVGHRGVGHGGRHHRGRPGPGPGSRPRAGASDARRAPRAHHAARRDPPRGPAGGAGCGGGRPLPARPARGGRRLVRPGRARRRPDGAGGR